MRRRRGRFQNGGQEVSEFDREMNALREQQQLHHRAVQKAGRWQPPLRVNVQLENGASIEGTAVCFNKPDMPKCRLFFKCPDRRELQVDSDVEGQVSSDETNACFPNAADLLEGLNGYLMALHEEALQEFPEWLEKHSARAGEENPCFNLDEIREEFKYKKYRFAVWRTAEQIGFFDDPRPQAAKFHRAVRLGVREMGKDEQGGKGCRRR